jgi:mRNA interferase MazF
MSDEDIAKALSNDIKNQGREQSGYRSLLVLSPLKYNQMSSLFLASPITSNSKGLRFEVPLPEALTTRGFVLREEGRGKSP